MEEDDPLFCLDTVRDFMISRGGKVRNHELVTHFKTFLNDPKKKAFNRNKFKDFVNTLAAVKLDESGEKLLVLKKKYRDYGGGPQESPKPTELAPLTPPPRKVHSKAAQFLQPEEEAEPERERPPKVIRDDVPFQQDQEESQDQPDADHSIPAPESELDVRPTEEVVHDVSPAPAPEVVHDVSPAPAPTEEEDKENVPDWQRQGMSEVEASVDGGKVAETATVTTGMKEATDSASLDGSSLAFSTPVSSRASSVSPEEEEKGGKVPMSVKERAKHINKIQSETDLSRLHHGRHRGRVQDGKEDDSSSVSSVGISMDATEREWMLVSAAADYHPMAKILLRSAHLAKRKDFISGFTALHWAAKHGKPEVVKLLCGTPGIHVNPRSNGGYTPLHLAAMQGHEDIIELLVQTYGADPNIRDYSGKKAKQYLRNSASTRAQQILQTRKLSTAGSGNGPFKRVGSYSAKIQKSGFFGINSGPAVRNSWSTDEIANSRRRPSRSPSPSPRASPRPSPRASPRPSPRTSPRESPKNDRKISGSQSDNFLMPPPMMPAPRKKKSKKNKNKGSDKNSAGMPRPASDPELTVPSKSVFI